MGLGDRIRAFFGMSEPPVEAPHRAMFAVGPVLPVDQLLTHMYARVGAVDRTKALSVPAVEAGRRTICSIATLPLEAVDDENRVQDHPLLRQINPDLANSVMLSQTVEDLMFDSVAWWRVTARGSDRYPSAAVRYDPGTVSLQAPDGYETGFLPSGLPTEGIVWMAGEPVPETDVIRFDSASKPLLVIGERVIRRAIALDEAADLYAANPRRRGFFTLDGPGPDPEQTEIDSFLDGWQRGGRERLDGWAPAGVKYVNAQDPTPAELQIIAQQQRADLAIANTIGLDPEDLGINVTSRTYNNATDRRRDRINDVLAPYMRAITDRLSMRSVTKRGVRVRFVLDDYLKADPKTRAEVQQIYVDMGVTDAVEVRKEEGKPPRPNIRPAVPQTQISAIPAGLERP